VVRTIKNAILKISPLNAEDVHARHDAVVGCSGCNALTGNIITKISSMLLEVKKSFLNLHIGKAKE